MLWHYGGCLPFALWPVVAFIIYGIVPGIHLAAYAAPMLIASLAILIMRRNLKCPNCGETFYGRRLNSGFYVYNDFRSKCGHCGHRIRNRGARDAVQ